MIISFAFNAMKSGKQLMETLMTMPRIQMAKNEKMNISKVAKQSFVVLWNS